MISTSRRTTSKRKRKVTDEKCIQENQRKSKHGRMTTAEIRAAMSPFCHYCFGPLEWGRGPRMGLGQGTLDRIDNDRNYAPNNVVAACYACNMMRNTMGRSDFYRFLYMNIGRGTDIEPTDPGQRVPVRNYSPSATADMVRQQGGRCYLTGLAFEYTRGSPRYPSVDRIDSAIGYTAENVAVCLVPINRMKNVYSVDETLEYLGGIRRRVG